MRSPVNETSVPVWRLGIWWFLGSEVVVFGGLIACYVLYRFAHPDWGAEAVHTLQWVGAINTVVLLTSSLTMILSHHAILEDRDSKGGAQYLLITILLGLLFLLFKAYEYTHEISAGLLPVRSLFWGFYYLMTSLHALHVLGGLIANSVVLKNIRQGVMSHRIESVGLYWHFVDVVWIILFPLLYLASSGGAG